MAADPNHTKAGAEEEEGYEVIPLVDEFGLNHAGAREVVIAVMGITGAGKSTLINQISGQEVEVGDGLEACTQHVNAFRMKYKGVNLTLLDSPGFNDTYRSDTDVLDSVCSFLSDTYAQGFRLSGIIYLHPISNSRMEGSSLRSLRMFRKLVGDDALSNVILTSTHWSRVSDTEGDRREADLRAKFWKPFLDNGAIMVRHTGELASALALLDALVDKARIVLEIQRELVDEGKLLIETAAGIALNEELIALQERYESNLQRVRDEMEDAIRENDQRAQTELAEVRRQLEDQIVAAKRNQVNLRERERVAAREKQQLQTQLQFIQRAFANEREELNRKFNQEHEELRSRLEAADRASEQAETSEMWSRITDITNSAVNAFLLYLSARRG